MAVSAQPQAQMIPVPLARPAGLTPATKAVVVALVVIASTVTAAWIYVMASALCNGTALGGLCGGAGTPGGSLDISLSVTGYNWTLSVSAISGGPFTLDSVTLEIFDNNGAPSLSAVRLSQLTMANCGTYHVTYEKVGSETTIVVGARLLVARPIYPPKYSYELANPATILAHGIFQ